MIYGLHNGQISHNRDCMITRKKFIRNALAAAAGTSLFGFHVSRATQVIVPDSPGFPTFDLHAHPGAFHQRGMANYAGEDRLAKTVGEMNSSRLSGAFFSMVVDTLVNKVTATGVVPAREFNKGEAWQEYKRQLAQLKGLCGQMAIRHATGLSDLTDPKSAGKVAAFFACEGGDFLEHAAQLDEVYADGVRSIQLVHYAPNPLGDLQTYQRQHNGLSALGRSVVKKMNALGMVIDVAHASHETVKQVADATTAPIILSHSILKLDAERPIAMRAITREHALVVAKTGGVIGAWPSGFNTNFDDYIDNILRLIDVVGVDHVGLGTDMDSNFKPVLDSYLQLDQWAGSLLAKGASKADVEKIAGGNAIRVLGKCLKA